MKHELEQLRAAARRDLPAQREDGVPHRLRPHLQRDAVGARGARRQRLPDHASPSASPTSTRSASHSTLAQGIPTIVPPDQSSGRVPLDRAAAEYTPEIDNIDRGYVQTWNVAFERRLTFDTSVDVAYVGAKGTGGYAALDINAPTVLGTRQPGPSRTATLGRIVAHQLVGRSAEDELSVAAGRAQQAVHARPAVQGRLHAQQVDERERQRRPRDPDLEHAERARPQLGAGRLRSPAQLPAGLRVCAAVAERRAATTTSLNAIVNDWQINGVLAAFSGTPVHGDRQRHRPEHAEQPADGRSDRRRSTCSATSARPARGSTRPRSRSRPAFASATPAATSSTARAARTSTSRCSGRSRSAGQRRLEVRMEAGNILNHPSTATRRAASRPARSARSPASRAAATYPERQIRLGLRFSF